MTWTYERLHMPAWCADKQRRLLHEGNNVGYCANGILPRNRNHIPVDREQGISILMCSPCLGNETANTSSKKQAIKATAQNDTLAEALLLGKKDPHPPASNYHKLKFNLGTLCALLWVLFGEQCNYFDNSYSLLNMLDSKSVFTNATNFNPLFCGQITWAIINDSWQYFFHTVMIDHLKSGTAR